MVSRRTNLSIHTPSGRGRAFLTPDTLPFLPSDNSPLTQDQRLERDLLVTRTCSGNRNRTTWDQRTYFTLHNLYYHIMWILWKRYCPSGFTEFIITYVTETCTSYPNCELTWDTETDRLRESRRETVRRWSRSRNISFLSGYFVLLHGSSEVVWTRTSWGRTYLSTRVKTWSVTFLDHKGGDRLWCNRVWHFLCLSYNLILNT